VAAGGIQPTKYWLSTLPLQTNLKELKQDWAWVTMKAEAGTGFTITPHLRRSLWVPDRRAEPFFPQSGRKSWITSPRSRHRTSARGGRVRPERHNPHSIATIRITIASYLLNASSPTRRVGQPICPERDLARPVYNAIVLTN
jgi:hypothetical protein